MKLGVHTQSIIVLTVICLVWGSLLAVVHDFTRESIERAENAEINAALSMIFPGGQFTSENGYYSCAENGVLVGYAVIAKGKGYGGEMKVVVGVDLDNRVAGVYVLSHSETIGVGSRATENTFLGQFTGKTLDNLRLTPDGAIDAITGATISSTAVTNAVHDGVQILIEGVGGAG
jgi:electron transport complex protein RnfG